MILDGEIIMVDARMLSRPIAAPHFAAQKSSLDLEPFQVDANAYLLHARDLFCLIHARVGCGFFIENGR